jgi:hypothetical protein
VNLGRAAVAYCFPGYKRERRAGSQPYTPVLGFGTICQNERGIEKVEKDSSNTSRGFIIQERAL